MNKIYKITVIDQYSEELSNDDTTVYVVSSTQEIYYKGLKVSQLNCSNDSFTIIDVPELISNKIKSITTSNNEILIDEGNSVIKVPEVVENKLSSDQLVNKISDNLKEEWSSW